MATEHKKPYPHHAEVKTFPGIDEVKEAVLSVDEVLDVHGKHIIALRNRIVELELTLKELGLARNTPTEGRYK